MCGIAGIHRRTDRPVERAGRLADELLCAIESRGTHSTGWLAMLPDGKVQTHKDTVRASIYVMGRPLFRSDFRTLLLHTRYATTGARTVRNAHPVISGSCAAIHNGTIWNHRAVFEQLALKRHLEVDSEVIPAIVDYAGWEQAATGLGLLDGGMAAAVVTNQLPNEVLLAKLTGYPLHYVYTKDLVLWASTRRAIEQAWWRTYGKNVPGRWVELPDFTLLRVNGKLEREPIEDRYSQSRWGRQQKRVWEPKSRPTGGRENGRKQQQSWRGSATNTASVAEVIRETSGFTYEQQVADDAVRDLMRYSGLTRDQAEFAVYGTTSQGDEDFLHDLYDRSFVGL